eukprot:s1582_g6.t1
MNHPLCAWCPTKRLGDALHQRLPVRSRTVDKAELVRSRCLCAARIRSQIRSTRCVQNFDIWSMLGSFWDMNGIYSLAMVGKTQGRHKDLILPGSV